MSDETHVCFCGPCSKRVAELREENARLITVVQALREIKHVEERQKLRDENEMLKRELAMTSNALKTEIALAEMFNESQEAT